MEVSEELMLTWGSHQQTLVNELAQLRHQGYFADVTLACEGRLYLAHKFILAMCSDYFRSIFGPSGVGGSNSSLVVVLKDVTCHDVEHLLDYMYTGVVSVQKSGLHSLIRTAENLQIKGLAFADSPDVPPAPSPERADGSFVSGPSRQEEAVTEDLSPGNSRRVNTMGPDVRLNRVGPIASRVPVNSREGISPPSKRKRLQDSLGQSVMNPSNTSSTYTNNVRTSSSSSQPQMYSSKRRVSSPGGQSSFSSSSPTDAPAMPLFTEPQSPLLPPGSPLQYRHSGGPVPVSLANKSFRDSPDRGPGSSSSLEHLLPVSCSAPSAVTSPPLPVSGPGGHCPKGRGGEQEDAVQRPENLEIKKEEPDGDPPPTGVATEILLSVDSGGPSTEASELKEEPPPEEGESGPSGLHAGLECWGAAGAEGGLLADATEEDDVSDTDGAGMHSMPKRSSRDARSYRELNSPARQRRYKNAVHTQRDEDLSSRRRESGPDLDPERRLNELRSSTHQERSGDPHSQRYQNSSALRREGRGDSTNSSKRRLSDKAANSEDDSDIIEIIGSSRVKNSTTGYRTNDQVMNDSPGDLIFQDGGICGFLEGFEPGTYLPPDGEFLTGMPHREEYLLSNESVTATAAQPTNVQDQMRYTCQFCGRNFDRMSNLKRHLLLHSGSKPFQCLYCEYRAAQKVNVVQHMANRHKEQMTALLCSQVNINDMLTPKD